MVPVLPELKVGVGDRLSTMYRLQCRDQCRDGENLGAEMGRDAGADEAVNRDNSSGDRWSRWV